MKGFEICINDAAPIVAMTDSLVTLIISVGYADGMICTSEEWIQNRIILYG